MLVRFAKCCNPLPGDPVAGYITRGRGVSVHNANCPHLERVDTERRVEVEWDVPDDQVLPVRIGMVSGGRPGLLADVAGVLKQQKVNILEADVRTTEDRHGVSSFLIQVHDTKQLQNVLKEIKKIKGVQSVKRMGLAG